MIQVSSYIQNAFSMDDVNKLLPVIDKTLEMEGTVLLDFSGIKFFTTLFFNNAITNHVLSLGPERYKKMFNLINLSEVGRTTYEHSLDNALSYTKLPSEQKTKAEHIISETLMECLD